jgi:hypothetical protein
MQRRLLFLAALGLLILLPLLAACSAQPSTSSTTPPAPTTSTTAPSTSPSPAGPPSIQITSPGSGNKFSIGGVTVAVQVSNFNLTDKIGGAGAAGEGHIIYYLDIDPPTAAGQPALTAPGTYFASSSISYAWTNIGSGQHKFAVQLVNDDNTPLVPPVTAAVSLLVIPEIGPPGMVILSPRNGAEISGNSVTVTVQVTNFNLADKIGQANAVREGHIIYYLDTAAPTLQGPAATTAPGTFALSAATTYTWPNLAAGPHSLAAQIVNNDNTPLNPPISSSVTVTLK